MRVNAMEGKVVLFIRDHQLKIQFINCLAMYNISFIECFDQEEIWFKLNLIHSEKRVYIHEYTEEEGTKQFELFKKIRKKGYKILVVFPNYSVEYIDNSHTAGVDDLMVNPVEDNRLIKKVLNLLDLSPEKEETLEETKDVFDKDKFNEAVVMEINRAERGHYVLSFVLIDFIDNLDKIDAHDVHEIIQQMNKALRETDIILKTEKKNTYLLICPFTPKDSLVEVENKIRNFVGDIKKSYSIKTTSKLYVYGLSFDRDGEMFDQFYERLKEGINDSKLLDFAFVTNRAYSQKGIEEYKEIFKKYRSYG